MKSVYTLLLVGASVLAQAESCEQLRKDWANGVPDTDHLASICELANSGKTVHAAISPSIDPNETPEQEKSVIIDTVSCDAPHETHLISKGELMNEVQKACGKPVDKREWDQLTQANVAAPAIKHHFVQFHYWSFDAMFADGKGASLVATDNSWLSGSAGPSKKERFLAGLAIATAVAVGLSFEAVCSQVYRKPLILMTANDYQNLQSCNANGYMLNGVYLYTGGK